MISHKATIANLSDADSPAIDEAFDIAWKALERLGSISPEDYYAMRAELERQILKLALAGRTDPVELASYATLLMGGELLSTRRALFQSDELGPGNDLIEAQF